MKDAGRALSVATVLVAVFGYAVIVLAGHALTPADYQRFTVYWGLFFACTGVLDGLLQETTRAVTAQRHRPRSDGVGRALARPATVTAGVSLATVALTLATAPVWADRLVPGTGGPGIGLLAVGLACYAVQATVCGLLSASSRWRSYAWLISIDSGVRVLLAAVAWALGWQLTAFLVVTVLGALTWTGLLLIDLPRTRRLFRMVADVTTGEFLRRCGAAMLASGASALLITGFPVLLTVTAAEVSPGALATVITAVTLTRAPLLVPLQRFTPALIVHFSRNRDRILGAIFLPVGGVIVTACVGGVLAWWLAVPVASWFFPAELVAGAGAFAVLTCASGALAVLTVTGTATLTAEGHRAYVAGWLTATVAAVLLLTTDFSPTVRSALALGVAPLTGSLVHLGYLATHRGHDAGAGGVRLSRTCRRTAAQRGGSSARMR